MKRKMISLLLVVCMLTLFGCTAQVEETQPEETQPEKVQLFTDAFFEDVVEICDFPCGEASGAQMEPVIQYLKSLTFTPTDTHLRTQNEQGEALVGGSLLSFIKSDGTRITFVRNHAILTCSDETGTYSYEVEEGINLNLGLQEAFSQALEQSDH